MAHKTKTMIHAQSWLAGTSFNPVPQVDESDIFGILVKNCAIDESYSKDVWKTSKSAQWLV